MEVKIKSVVLTYDTLSFFLNKEKVLSEVSFHKGYK